MKFLAVLLLATLVGCGIKPTIINEPELTRITVPSADRRKCPDLPFPAEGGLDEEGTGELLANWSIMYASCSGRGDRLLRIIDDVNAENRKL